jgi:hypothetical protein
MKDKDNYRCFTFNCKHWADEFYKRIVGNQMQLALTHRWRRFKKIWYFVELSVFTDYKLTFTFY